MSPLQDFMAGFAFCGPLQSNVESIGTRFLNRATDGVNRGMEAAQTKQPQRTGTNVDVWADGTSAEHIQRMKIIWEHLLNSSDGGREIADPQLLLSMLVGKTITDIIMYGSIPAKDKLLEVEMVFAENRLELGTTAKEFVLDMADHGENWKLINKMMMPHDGQPPMFWQIAQIMSIKGNCKDEFDNLIQEFMSFAYCFVSEIMKKYPNGGYDREKLLPCVTRWLGDAHPYTVRFAIEMLMTHYLREDFSPEYPAWVAAVESDHYYIRMMQAWYFATALAFRYEEILPYLTEDRLSPWVRQKTIQKAEESFRVPPEHKAELKALRR